MQRLVLVAAVALAAAIVAGATAAGDHEPRYRPLPDTASWATVLKTTIGLEGLTADRHGNLYTPGRGVTRARSCARARAAAPRSRSGTSPRRAIPPAWPSTATATSSSPTAIAS